MMARTYVSGSMSSMNGGEFFKFIFGCWHSLTTLSMAFQVFSMVRLSITNFGGAIASEKAPWRRLNRFVMDCDGTFFTAAIGTVNGFGFPLNFPIFFLFFLCTSRWSAEMEKTARLEIGCGADRRKSIQLPRKMGFLFF